MSIAVKCRCGKAFKVKDHLAGKAVRCPACRGPLRIPGGPARKPDAEEPSAELDKSREKEAILRFEAAQRRKMDNAETEAAYREEQNKLIEGYDQLVGKTAAEKGKKRELAGEKRRKATIFTKLRDAVAVVCGTLLVRYMVLVVLLAGGAIGSIYLVRYMAGYMQDQTTPSAKSKEERIQEYYKQFDEAYEAQRWSAASDALKQVLIVDPTKEINREYTGRKQKLEAAISR